MNYLIQRSKVRGQVIKVPEGLPELLSDITREVLRCQPQTECLCQFIIDYLHSVIVTREKARVAKDVIEHALHSVDEIISELCICDIAKDKADQMVLVMEDCFKRFLEQQRRCEKTKDKETVNFHEFGMLDELINRCKFSEDELKISRPLIEAAYERFVEAYMSATEETEGTEALYQYFKERALRRMEQQQMIRAATRIQASFRGYAVRRSMLPKKKERKYLINATPSQLEEMQRAAVKIQRFYRLHAQDNQSLFLMYHCGEAREYAYADICSPPSAQSVKKEKRSGEICSNASISSLQVGMSTRVKMISYTESEDLVAPPQSPGSQKSEQELKLATTYVSKPLILIDQVETPESSKPQVIEEPTVEPELAFEPEAAVEPETGLSEAVEVPPA